MRFFALRREQLARSRKNELKMLNQVRRLATIIDLSDLS